MRLAPRDAQTAIMPSRPFVFSATTILSLALLILLATSHWSEARTVRWAKQAGAADSEASTAIGVDGSGNSYITGYFGGSTTLGLGEANQTTLVSAGASDLFLAKYSPSGALIWAKRAGGTGFEEAFAITVDGSGNSYVTGYFEGAASFGPGEANQTILPAPAGGAGIFIAKYNSNGALVWAKRAAGSGSGQGFGITVSKTENVYVTGSFTGSVSFGLGEANQKTLTSDGGFDLFIAKYDSNGALLWARRAGGTGSDEAFASAVDDAGNVSVTGSFEGTAIFGLGEPNQTILNSSGSN
jgi:hypothetical protein